MAAREKTKQAAGPAAVLLPADSKKKSIPDLARAQRGLGARGPAHAERRRRGWRRRASRARRGSTCCCRAPRARSPASCWGSARRAPAIPWTGRSWPLGHLASVLPPGRYHLADEVGDAELAAVAWGLGAYRFRRYKIGRAARRRAQLEAAARRRPCPRAGDGRGGLAGPRPHQHAGERPGPRRSWRMPRASSPSGTAPACRASSATTCSPRTFR